MRRGVMNTAFLTAVFIILLPVCAKEPARYRIQPPKASTFDLISHKQDVVQTVLEPEFSPVELLPNERNSPTHLATKIKLVARCSG